MSFEDECRQSVLFQHVTGFFLQIYDRMGFLSAEMSLQIIVQYKRFWPISDFIKKSGFGGKKWGDFLGLYGFLEPDENSGTIQGWIEYKLGCGG